MNYLCGKRRYNNLSLPIETYSERAMSWLITNKPEVIEAARAYVDEKHLCWHCGRRLVKHGDARRNGADRTYRSSYRLHLTCWMVLKKHRKSD